MYSLSILLSLLSVLSVFMTDRAVLLPNEVMLKQFLTQKKIAIVSAIVFLTLSFLAIISEVGTATAALASVVSWMLWASIITLFEPFKKLMPFYSLICCAVAILLESLIH